MAGIETMSIDVAHRDNQLLALLAAKAMARLAPHFNLCKFAAGDTLQEQGVATEYAWFPCAGIVASRLMMADDDAGVTLDVVGREGSVCSDAQNPSTARYLACVSGTAWRIRSSVLHRLIAGTEACDLLLAYNAVCNAATQQAAACHLLHDVESRLCRWILTLHDRLAMNPIPLTHSELANLTGIRRTTITQVAGALQAAGILDNRRGRMRIADRFALEAAACECYRATRQRRASFDDRFAARH